VVVDMAEEVDTAAVVLAAVVLAAAKVVLVAVRAALAAVVSAAARAALAAVVSAVARAALAAVASVAAALAVGIWVLAGAAVALAAARWASVAAAVFELNPAQQFKPNTTSPEAFAASGLVLFFCPCCVKSDRGRIFRRREKVLLLPLQPTQPLPVLPPALLPDAVLKENLDERLETVDN
jgi:hypothetical protein